MLRAIGAVVKVAVFTVLVLVGGNLIEWRGKTLSETVRDGVGAAERSGALESMRGWVRGFVDGVSVGDRRKGSATLAAGGTEDYSSSERKKLRELIRELNASKAERGLSGARARVN